MATRGAQQPTVYRAPDGQATNYLLALPVDYDADAARRWPLLLFLHGAGERGDNLDAVRSYGPAKRIDDGLALPCIVVSPQCPIDARWSVPILDGLLNETERLYRIDPEQVLVTGLSMGGFGAWALGIADPQRFAALAPVCAGGDPAAVCALRGVPVWAFHGARDDVVPLQRGAEMVTALRACGGDVRFTVYPEAGHDSWTETYANPDLYGWLLNQRRRG